MTREKLWFNSSGNVEAIMVNVAENQRACLSCNNFSGHEENGTRSASNRKTFALAALKIRQVPVKTRTRIIHVDDKSNFTFNRETSLSFLE